MTRKTGEAASKKKSSDSKSAKPATAPPRQDGVRETFESIVVAFVLAFLFRTFEAEAFVIPTGSMAPTLLGRHKDVDCEKCGTHFTVGASDEVHSTYGFLVPSNRLETAFCPSCRYEINIRDLPVYKGDRILVNKFPYEFGEPDRFDVIVFKFPEEPTTNYIKRLIGLPGEEIMIERGDVFARSGDTWQILRKDDPNKQRAIQLSVYTTDDQPSELYDNGYPRRWMPMERTGASDGIAGWTQTDDGWHLDESGNTYELGSDAASDAYKYIRYRHIVPTPGDWERVDSNPEALAESLRENPPAPELITDNCGYNTYTSGHTSVRRVDFGYYWVGDLTVTGTFEVDEAGPDAALLLELNEGVRAYRCEIDLNTGTATLSHVDSLLDPDQPTVQVLATAETEVQGPGTYQLRFANVDDRLCLWVKSGSWGTDKLIEFDAPTTYVPPALPKPTDADLIPAAIAAKGASVKVSHIRLERDIYYRSEFVVDPHDYSRQPRSKEEYESYSKEPLNRLLGNPAEWYAEYKANSEPPAVFAKLGPDEFFVMGDNSPRSKDSRLWSNTRRAQNRHAVPRSALIGKAFFIYWPHGVPFLNDGEGIPIMNHRTERAERTDYPTHRVPFYPHVDRMNRIR